MRPVKPTSSRSLVEKPEELVYRACYAPADLASLLESAETRSSIRKLPPAQLFFSLKELDESQIAELLPHITEAQWTTILDLDTWSKDELSSDRFLSWEKYILACDEAVARKLLRGTDPELWVFSLKRGIQVFPRDEDGEFGEEALSLGQYTTPDGNYMIVLPRNVEKARLYQQLLQKLYGLDPALATGLIESCRLLTSSELEEEAYQNRRRRIEDLGFQDYFDAIEIYTCRNPDEELPTKSSEDLRETSSIPARIPGEPEEGPLLVFQALASLAVKQEIQWLVEELFYVCNKLLSADRISPDQPDQIKRGLLKTISCLNLGLDAWSQGEIGRAVEGVRQHYLQSFFQIGYGRLIGLQEEAQQSANQFEPDPGSYLEAALEAMQQAFPELAEQTEGKISKRFFQTEEDLHWGRKLLEQLRSGRK